MKMILHQLDDEYPAFGPILNPDHTAQNPSYYVPAVGDTVTLVIKSSHHVADAAGTTYDGTLAEDDDNAGQWWAVFPVPKGDLPTLSKKFGRVRVIDADGNEQTIWGGDVEVDPGRQAQRAIPTTAPVLNLGLPAHIADTTDAHDATAVSVTPFGTIAATNVQAALEEVATEAGGTTPDATTGVKGKVQLAGDLAGTAAAPTVPGKVDKTGAQMTHRVGVNGDEPGAFIAWTADDGYTTQADYFALLDTKGIDGTLFLTQNWVDKVGVDPTWSDTYITTAQVQAIVAAGHELGTHGVNHENHLTYLSTNGVAAFVAHFTGCKTFIESTFGVTVRTGAYPAGLSDTRVRELMGRIGHDYYRGTKGIVSRGPNHPMDVPGVDIQALSEAQIKVYVDEAVANRTVAVFLLHGGLTGPDLTKFGNVMDYAAGLGVPQGTFYEAMNQRTMWRSTGAMIDAQGAAFHPEVRTNRVEVSRDDLAAETVFIDIDEATNVAYLDQIGGTPFEFRKGVDFKVATEHRGQTTLHGVFSARAVENMIQPTTYTSDTEFLLRVRRSAAAGTDASADLLRLDHRGKGYWRGPAAELLVQSVAGVSRSQVTNAGVIRANDAAGAERASLNGTGNGSIKLWDSGTSTLRTITMVSGALVIT